MKEMIEQQLHKLLNKTLLYGNKLVEIKGYRIDEERERVYLHSNERENHWDRPYDGVMGLLNEFQEVKGDMVKIDPVANAITAANGMAGELKDILMDNIKKVQNDAGYIKQATVINNNVNTLVNLTKLQLSHAKMVADSKHD